MCRLGRRSVYCLYIPQSLHPTPALRHLFLRFFSFRLHYHHHSTYRGGILHRWVGLNLLQSLKCSPVMYERSCNILPETKVSEQNSYLLQKRFNVRRHCKFRTVYQNYLHISNKTLNLSW